MRPRPRSGASRPATARPRGRSSPPDERAAKSRATDSPVRCASDSACSRCSWASSTSPDQSSATPRFCRPAPGARRRVPDQRPTSRQRLVQRREAPRRTVSRSPRHRAIARRIVATCTAKWFRRSPATAAAVCCANSTYAALSSRSPSSRRTALNATANSGIVCGVVREHRQQLSDRGDAALQRQVEVVVRKQRATPATSPVPSARVGWHR